MNTNTSIDTQEIVLYCGQEVELLGLDQSGRKTEAHIRFEDGREDYVPLSTIKDVR